MSGKLYGVGVGPGDPKSVSYTHLDVYKRQVQALAEKKSAEERSELSDLDRLDSWQQNYSRHLALKLSLTTEVSLRKQKHLESSINH